MKVLAIETATAAGGVALAEQGELVFEAILGRQAAHAERLAPTIERALAEAGWKGPDLDGIAVAVGPGSYTGLRIGLATAKTLAWAWGRPLAAVGTLEAMAWPWLALGLPVAAAMDARHSEVHGALYEPGPGPPGAGWPEEWVVPVAVFPPEALPAETFFLRVREKAAGSRAGTGGPGLVVVGDGGVHHRALAQEVLGPAARVAGGPGPWVRPGSVARLGWFRLSVGQAEAIESLEPQYLKASEAERRWRQRN